MTILFICEEYPPGPCGGIGTYTRMLARELVRRGHRVLVAGLYPPGFGSPDHEVDEGVEVWRIRLAADRWMRGNNGLRDRILGQVLNRTGMMRPTVCRAMERFHDFVEALIRIEKVDLVEWPDFSTHWKYLEPGSLRPLSVPVLVKCHGTDTYLRAMTGQVYSQSAFAVERAHLERAAERVAVSRFTARQYQTFFSLESAPPVVYNGIDRRPGANRQPNNSKTVVYSGSISRLKGVDSLMRAWNDVHRLEPDARLLLFGKGRAGPFLRLLGRPAKASVRFCGYVSRERLLEVYAGAALAVFPSRMECFALAPLEAMSAGCPVVYTDRASGPELVTPGVNGLLANPDDPASLAAAICQLLKHPVRAEEMGMAGKFHVKSALDLHLSASLQEEIYRRMVEGLSQPALNRDPARSVY